MKTMTPFLAEGFLRGYLEDAQRFLESVIATDVAEVKVDFFEAVSGIADFLEDFKGQLIVIGNGGSAGIASETAHRLGKFCGVRALTFNNPVTMSGTANDHGWDEVFAQPLNVYSGEGDILIAISSSGRSPNILRAVEVARTKNFGLILTLSGFNLDNPLRSKGNFNFYVPSDSYRHVERTHLFVLDCILDLLIKQKRGN